jgi:ABC-type dipeptide/oligopeptide/nickel transport system permease subunit
MTAPDTVTPHGRSLWQEAWRRLRRQRVTMACLALIGIYAAVALYGEVVYRWYEWKDRTPAYQDQNLAHQYQPPSLQHPCGTDNLGRDVGARLIQGTRVAFHVGIITSLIAIPIGIFLGCLAGYYGSIRPSLPSRACSSSSASPWRWARG